MVSIVSLQAGHPFKLLNARSSQSLLCTCSSLTCCSSLSVWCSPWAYFWWRAPSNRQKILHQLGLLVFHTCRERRRGWWGRQPSPGGQGGAVEPGAGGKQVYLMHSLLTELRVVYLRYIFSKKNIQGQFCAIDIFLLLLKTEALATNVFCYWLDPELFITLASCDSFVKLLHKPLQYHLA